MSANLITTIDLNNLSMAQRMAVLDQYREALKKEDATMTVREAAWMYGYTYSTLRWYVAKKQVKATGRKQNRRITHAAMREYVRNKKTAGTPRKSMRSKQTQLA